MYIEEILWLISWPVYIFVITWVIIRSVKHFEKKHAN